MYGKTLRGTRVYNTLCACDFGLLLLCVSSVDTVAHSSVGELGEAEPAHCGHGPLRGCAARAAHRHVLWG